MSDNNISPLAPASFPPLPDIRGVQLSVTSAGIKYRDRIDVWLAELVAGSTVAGVFTRSKTASAPIDWCREILGDNAPRAIMVNSGNANAFTGIAGQTPKSANNLTAGML